MHGLNGPDFIALQVTNLEADKRFYMEAVGLRPAPHSPPDAVVFATEPVSFAIRKPLVDLSLTPYLGHGVALWFRTEDSPALLEHLQAQNVELMQPLGVSPFGKTLTFRDPDGHMLTAHDGG